MDEYIPGEFGEESLPADFTEPVTTKIQDRSAASPPVLILASPQLPEARIGTFFWLAHALGLDMYGTSTLSYAARLEMTSAALVLTIIFLFDAGAWCLLFYFILNSGSLDLHPGRMLLSLGGILPALALLLYERGFMTADTRTHGWRRLVFPTALRVCVIFGAGWITAQPVELMAFARRIERRVQDELIRKDIVGHYHKLKKAEEEQKKGSIQLVKHDEHDLNVVHQDLTDKNSRLAAVDADLEKSKKAQSTGEARLQQARNQLREARAKSIVGSQSSEEKDAIAQMEQAVQAALAAYNDRTARVAEQQRLRDVLKKSIDAETANLEGLRSSLASDFEAGASQETEEKLLLWADKLRGVQPSEDFPKGDGNDPETGFKFRFVDYSFLDKFRIIADLMKGRPARWPGAEQDKIQFLQETYGLYDDNDNPNDPQAKERITAEASNAQRTYFAVFGVAMIIPFMSLLFKLIMPAPLSYYYSSMWQSKQGHPEAMAMEAAAYSMKVQLRENASAMPSGNGIGPENTKVETKSWRDKRNAG